MKRLSDRSALDEDVYGPLLKVVRFNELPERERKRLREAYPNTFGGKRLKAHAVGGTPVKPLRPGKSFSRPPQRRLL